MEEKKEWCYKKLNTEENDRGSIVEYAKIGRIPMSLNFPWNPS